jgi:hypothetical protein
MKMEREGIERVVKVRPWSTLNDRQAAWLKQFKDWDEVDEFFFNLTGNYEAAIRFYDRVVEVMEGLGKTYEGAVKTFPDDPPWTFRVYVRKGGKR